MGKRILVVMGVVACLAAPAALADDIVPAAADSEGLEQFEKSVSAAQPPAGRQKAKPAHPDNFGAVVSGEAQKLRNSGGDARQQMGAWVSSQRRKSADPTAPAGAGASDSRGSAVSSSASLPNGLPRPNDAAPGRPAHGRGPKR